MTHLYLLILPLLSFVLVGLLGGRLGIKWSQLVSCTFMAGATTAAILLFNNIALGDQVIRHTLFSWIETGTFKISWGLYIDTLSAVMVVVVTLVSLLVHLYSIGYMAHDRTPFKFMAYLSLFTFMMLVLVTGDNLLQVFFGWEGVGLASYLLIGYWYERPSACAASVKAFVVNRVGDLGFVLGIGGFFLAFKTLDIPLILAKVGELEGALFQIGNFSIPVLEMLAFFLFIGAMGKSAQIGLHTWLPDAMEGPTPVSALIHAATMVTAGVFLVARFSSLYELAPYVKQLMTCIGSLTAFFAGTIALTQTDIKRVIAYSTCSQLGYMFMALGLGAYHLALFHLTTHAFFKALLFLGAGSVIHAMSDEQDMRKMGGIGRFIPVTYAVMWVGSAALAGLPFFAGYYSKDAILERAFHTPTWIGQGAYIIGIVAVFLTAIYSWRLLYLTFHGKARANEHVMGHLHEPGLAMILPLIALAIGAVFSGFIGVPYFTSPIFWSGAVEMNGLADHETVGWLHHLPTFISVLGIGFATLIYLLYPYWPNRLAQIFKGLYRLSFNKWYIDEMYDRLFVKGVHTLGRVFWKKGDAHLIDTLAIEGATNWAIRVSRRLSQMHTGLIFHYALWMMVGVAAVLLWLILQ